MQRAQQRVGPPPQGPAGHEHHDRPHRQGGGTTALRRARKRHRGLRLGLAPGLLHRHLGDHAPRGFGVGVDRLSRVDRRRSHGHRLRRHGHGLKDLRVLAALVRGGGQLRGRRRRRQVPPSFPSRRHGDGLRGLRQRLQLVEVDPLGGPSAINVIDAAGTVDGRIRLCVVVEQRPTGERTGHDEAPCLRVPMGSLRPRGYATGAPDTRSRRPCRVRHNVRPLTCMPHSTGSRTLNGEIPRSVSCSLCRGDSPTADTAKCR